MEIQDRIEIVDDCSVTVTARCRSCGAKIHVPYDLFFPNDIGENDYYLTCDILCKECGVCMRIVAPEVFGC